jgi:3-hydroxyisobutyrate dehydrogenase-like beta-hydroxyacid dehydrogenase
MNTTPPYQTTIGILYPGEMGSTLGALLCEGGFRVLTTVDGRSARTRSLCEQAGLKVVESLLEVLRRSDVVISLVLPGAALSAAREVAALLQESTRSIIYVDANSISPMTVAQISEVLCDAPVDFVDASIFGLASQLRQRGSLYLSGPRAKELSDQLSPIMRVKAVGDSPGQASALKMIVSGIPKGLSGLFLETMLLAEEMDLVDEAIQACDEIYPSVMEIVRRMLPTYPQHATRRCEELNEVAETMRNRGLTPHIMRGVREVTSTLANTDWAGHDKWTMTEMIEKLHRDATTRQIEPPSPNVPEQRARKGPVSVDRRSAVAERSALQQ